MTPHQSKILWPAVTLTVAAGLAIFYFFADPASARWMPKCLFHSLTGLSCPGCGSQRFFHALLHGHPAEAISYNPFFIITIPYLLILALTSFLPSRFPRLSAATYSPSAIMIVLIAIVLWTIIRNIFGI